MVIADVPGLTVRRRVFKPGRTAALIVVVGSTLFVIALFSAMDGSYT